MLKKAQFYIRRIRHPSKAKPGRAAQRAPVLLDPTLSTPLTPNASAVRQFGKLAWGMFDTYFTLDTPVRQAPDSNFSRVLNNLRDGSAGGDLAFWQSRRLMWLSPEEKPLYNMDDEEVLYATCFNRDRDRIIMDYRSRRPDTVIVKSRCIGTHAIATNHIKGGPCKKIPITAYLSIGMTVKLVVNIVPKWGLYNNSRGFVRDFFFTDDHPGYDPDNQGRMPVVIVEFPSYTGPAMSDALALAGRSTWVAISAVERRCDCKACSRFGLPLVCGKADSVHSLQGFTIGDTKKFKRLVLNWSQQAEALWAGALYVGASRMMAPHNLAIDFQITSADLEKKWQRRALAAAGH